MPGSNGRSSYFSIYGDNVTSPIDLSSNVASSNPQDQVEENDARVRSLEAQGYLYNPTNGQWISPGQAYQNARAGGLSRRAARVYRDQGAFLYGMSQDQPDFDYVYRNLRANGLTRRAAREAMRNPEFWRNIRRKYGPQQETQQPSQPVQPEATQRTITAAPMDAHEAALRDKMDAEARAHEQAGDIYDPTTGTWSKPQPEVAQDDLTSIASFGEAFRTARQRGLKQFKWKSTKANPSGLFGTQLRQEVRRDVKRQSQSQSQSQGQSQDQEQSSQQWRGVPYAPPPVEHTLPGIDFTLNPAKEWTSRSLAMARQYTQTPQSAASPKPQTQTQSYTGPAFSGEDYYTGHGMETALRNQYYNWFKSNHPDRAKYSRYTEQQAGALPGYQDFARNALSQYERRGGLRAGYVRKQQSGGKMEKQQLQKLFTAFLIQQSGAKTEQELTDFIKQLGEDGLKSMYQKFIQSMQEGTQSAKSGAKLNYIKSLRGKCPEGFELGYFKEGGKVCAKCIAKQEKQGAIQFRPMQGEKGTKMVQDFKKELKTKKDKINISKKKTDKKEFGGTIQIDQKVLDAFKCGGKVQKDCKGASMKNCKGGLVKKSNKIPIKQKFIESDKCGGKTKKKKK